MMPCLWRTNVERVFLDGFSTTAGFLQHAPISFSRKLTCVIGARGTCKATLIESIRFCLTRDDTRTAMLLGRKPGEASHPAFGLIKDTLGAGTARMTVTRQTPEGDTVFSIERNPDSEPLVYRDTVRQH